MIKRIVVAVLFVVFLIPAGTARAFGGPELSLGLRVGTSFYQDDKISGDTVKFDRANVLGVTAGIRQGRLGGELSVDWLRSDLKNSGDLGQLKSLPVLLTGQFHLLGPGAGLDPYIGAGVGYYVNSFDSKGSGGNATVDDAVGFHAAAGASLNITSAVALTFDLRYALSESDYNAGASSEKLKADAIVALVGARYIFLH